MTAIILNQLQSETMKYSMNNMDQWENEVLLYSHLANHLNNCRIVLVLGAGVSEEFGLPNWQKLISDLYKLKGHTENDKLSPEQKILYFKEKLCSNAIDYMSSIQKALYEGYNFDFKNLKNFSTLSALSALIMASKRGNASNVVTFNFDNILELYLSYYGFISNSRILTKHWSANADVNIYHPHGYIPALPSDEFSDKIVFDHKSYMEVIGDDSNPWRQHVLSLFRTNFCIFIGLSGKDSNFESFLYKAKESHVAIEEGQLFWGMNFILESEDTEVKELWKDKGIFVKEIKSYSDGIPDCLYKICQVAAQNR
jgi:hypothetical protein